MGPVTPAVQAVQAAALVCAAAHLLLRLVRVHLAVGALDDVAACSPGSRV